MMPMQDPDWMDLMQDPDSMGLMEDQFQGPYGGSGFIGLMEDPVPWALWSIRFHGPHAGVEALAPICGGASWRPKADIMEAEGRPNGNL